MLAYSVLAAEVAVRLGVVPFLMMSGGVTIANHLGFSVVPSFVLFMAVNSLVGFPWIAKAGLDLIIQMIYAQQQAAALAAFMDDAQKHRFDEVTRQSEDK